MSLQLIGGQELGLSSCRWGACSSLCGRVGVFHMVLFVVNRRAAWSLISEVKCMCGLRTVSVSAET